MDANAALRETTLPPPQHRNYAVAVVASLAALLLPFIALFAPLGLAPLGFVVMTAIVLTTWREQPWRRIDPLLAVLVGCLSLYGAVSAFWALDPQQSFTTSLRVGVVSLIGLWMVSCGATLPRQHHRIVLLSLAFSLLISGILLGWEYLSDRSLSQRLADIKGVLLVGNKSHLNRGATMFALSLWPLAVLASRCWGRVVAITLTGAGVAIILLGDSGSSKLAVASAAILFILCWLWPRLILRLSAYGLVFVVVVLPILAAQLPAPQKSFEEWRWLPLSAHHRLTIWTFTGQRIADKPILGWGMDGARSIPDGDKEIRVTRSSNGENEPAASLLEALLPLHPHNAILQWWLELGVPGTACLAAFFFVLIRRIERSTRPVFDKATFLAMFTTGLVISLNSYGFWQNWWQAGIWLTAFLWAIASADRDRQS